MSSSPPPPPPPLKRRPVLDVVGCNGGSSGPAAVAPSPVRHRLARTLLRMARRAAATGLPLLSPLPPAPLPPSALVTTELEDTPRGLLLRTAAPRVDTVVAVSDVRRDEDESVCEASSDEHVVVVLVVAPPRRRAASALASLSSAADGELAAASDIDLARLRNSRAQHLQRNTSNCPSLTLCAVHIPHPKHCARTRGKRR